MSRAALDTVLERLRTRAAAGGPLVQAFASWFRVSDSQAERPLTPTGIRTYGDVAINALRWTMALPTARPFPADFAWLSGREHFRPYASAGFEADPLAILAVAIGANRLQDEDGKTWIANIAQRAAMLEDGWRRSLLSAAQSVSGRSPDVAVVPELVVALSAAGLGSFTEEQSNQAFSAAFDVADISADHAVVRFAALRAVLQRAGTVQISTPTEQDVVTLLRSIPAALKRWPWEATRRTKNSTTQRWDVQNEYHVQSLAWAILRPVFPDIKDEEYLASLGYTHPRVDLCIPSLRLIIEVKYMRESHQSARTAVESEIAADTGLYLTRNSGYDRIIALVWDAVAAVQHHATLEAGLQRLPGVLSAVVVSRPGDWI